MNKTEASKKFLVDNDWDYQKYGDKRSDRAAYETRMCYEISDLLEWAFTSGFESACDLIAREVPMSSGAFDKLRKIRDGLPFEPVPKMRGANSTNQSPS